MDISLMAMDMGLWPGFRLTTATFIHSEPRSMLETAGSEGIKSREKVETNTKRIRIPAANLDIFAADLELQPKMKNNLESVAG